MECTLGKDKREETKYSDVDEDRGHIAREDMEYTKSFFKNVRTK